MADKGLREVIAADTHLSDIDGEKGTLSYVGYEIEDLAAQLHVRGGRLPPPPPGAPHRRRARGARRVPGGRAGAPPVPGPADEDPRGADLADVDAAHVASRPRRRSTPTGGTSRPMRRTGRRSRLIAKTRVADRHVSPPAHRAGDRAAEPGAPPRRQLPVDAARRRSPTPRTPECSTPRSSSTRITR